MVTSIEVKHPITIAAAFDHSYLPKSVTPAATRRLAKIPRFKLWEYRKRKWIG